MALHGGRLHVLDLLDECRDVFDQLVLVEAHLADAGVDVAPLVSAVFDLAGLEILDRGGDVARNHGAGFGRGHEAARPQYLAEAADLAHHVLSRQGDIEIKPVLFLNLLQQIVAAREIRAGRQAYVVYPLVEESEKMDLRDATRRFEYLRDRVFPKFSVGLLHGRMKSEEKDEVMRRFVKGETQILVSTTVIEVGVDVPNASVMIVEHAERFGLSQLHQLRGRVGRGAEQSYCVLLASDKQTEVARERLGIMEETNDGFKIAERDLEIRGPGEVLGTRQAGLPEFRVANLVRDLDILQTARKEAEFYLNQRKSSPEVAKMIKRVQSDARLKLAAVG